MKILRLALSNLASLVGEQEIDFEKEPLASAGLIAITGKTGAGKSTLLDAMCLALFDQIPRLNGAIGALQDVSGQGISIKDSKNILRRGCVAGFAELEFLALDQKRYLARWEIKRARNKVDGNLKVDRAVTCLEDGQVLTQKISECTPTVQKLIGLSFEQFTRAVLLAQSEVGAFLKAKDQDRADLLEYLTNSSIFSVIGQLSYQKTKTFTEKLKQYQDLFGHIELLTPEQIQVIENQQKALGDQIQKKEKLLKEYESSQRWYQTKSEFQYKIQEKQQSLDLLLIHEPAIQLKKTQLQQLEQFAEIRSVYQQKQHSQQQLHVVQQQISITQQQFAEIEKQQKNALQEIQTAEHTLRQEQIQQEKLHPVLEQARQYDADLHYLRQSYTDQNKKLSELSDQKKSIEQRIVKIEQQQHQTEFQQKTIATSLEQSQNLAVFDDEPTSNQEKIHNILLEWQRLEKFTSNNAHFNIENFKQHFSKLKQDIEVQQKQFGDLEYLEKQILNEQQKLVNLQQQQHNVEKLGRSLSQYQLLNEKYCHYLAHREHLVPTCLELQQKVEQTQKDYEQASEKLKQLQDFLQEQKLIHAAHIQDLRKQLKPDQACMVCGSTEHPFVEHTEHLQQSLTHIQNSQEQQAILTRDQSFTLWQQTLQNWNKQSSELNSLELNINEFKQSVNTSKNQVITDIKASNLLLDANLDFDELFKQYQQLTDQQIRELNLQQKKYESLTQAQQTVRSLKRQLEQQQTIQLQIEKIETMQNSIVEKLNIEWQEKWQLEPQSSAQQLLQQIQKRQVLLQQQKQIKEQLQDYVQQKLPLLKNLELLTEQIAKQSQSLEELKQQGVQVRNHLVELIQQHCEKKFNDASTWASYLTEQLKSLDTFLQLKQKTFKDIDEQYQKQRLHLNELKSSEQTIQKQIQEQQKQQQNWQDIHPDFSQTLIADLLKVSHHETQQLRHDIEKHQNAVIETQSSMNTLKDQFNAHLKDAPQLKQEEILHHIETVNKQLTEIKTESNDLQVRLATNAQRQNEQKQYQSQIDEIQKQVHRWGKISELVGSADGTKFKKIAQQHHLDILVEYANQQLQPLSPRYQLQRIPDSLGLAIIDQDMNGEIRPVLSLSGGETFLVSLALALAIANMASGSMKLESLFIDEGFGTLDPASLHMVMDALDRLQSQGRKVVLISHVQEMHERIPVQIQVKPLGAGASTLSIVG